MVAIEVRVGRMACLHRGLDECARIDAGFQHVCDVKRAARAVILIGTPKFIVLRLPEVRQNIRVAPARVTLRGPSVVVGAVSAHVHHAVDRTAAAKGFAAWLVADAAVKPPIRQRLERPVIDGVWDERCQSRGALNQHALVRWARFKQTHLNPWIFAQARSQHTARRAPADHNVVDHDT